MTVHEPLELGRRVILSSAQTREPSALGTVIEMDPYGDRGSVVRVLHDDKRTRWRRVGDLRGLDFLLHLDDLASDLRLLGYDDAAARVPAAAFSPSDGKEQR